jgi:hypothetical protein
MPTHTIPRNLVDFDSPRIGAYLALKCAMKDEIGDVSQEQENALWTMIQEHNISYKEAQDFAKKKTSDRKKRALEDCWQSTIFNNRQEGTVH